MIGLNGGTYTWRITDPQIVDSMLHAEYKQVFKSEIFEIANLKWQVLLYPNGHEPKWKGSFCVRLKLIDIPQMIAKIVFFRQFRLLETGSSHSYISQCDEGGTPCASAYCLLYLSQASKLKQISIQLKLLIYGIIMKQQNIWMMNNIPNNSLSVKFPLKQVLTYSAPKPSDKYFTLPYNEHESDIQGGNGFYWVLTSYPSG
eukprot:171393_1